MKSKQFCLLKHVRSKNMGKLVEVSVPEFEIMFSPIVGEDGDLTDKYEELYSPMLGYEYDITTDAVSGLRTAMVPEEDLLMHEIMQYEMEHGMEMVGGYTEMDVLPNPE
jgi:hypothetical protein